MGNKAKRKNVVITIILVSILLILGLYKAGFRFTDEYTLGKIGYLNINTPVENTSIIIDRQTKILSTKQSEKIALSPKTHEIIISRDGYYPWTKKIKIPSNNTLIIFPIFISQSPSGEIITQNDYEYWKIKNTVEKDVLPSSEKPLLSKDGKTSVWLDNNAILVKDQNSIHTVIQPETTIKNISFYKDRNDVLIFSTDKSVYAIETDTTNTQNFYPIYKGTNPRFIVATTSALYVLDGDLLMEVVI